MFEPITDNALANMGTYQFQKMLKDALLLVTDNFYTSK